jgi:serine/threonine-protein kinase
MQTLVATAAGHAQAATELRIDPPDALAPGVRAGPWIVERELGRGGMGAVYAVVHEGIGKRAALKLMHQRLAAGASAERILLEARVVNQVCHPNIVDIFETGALSDGRPYIVMERLEGVSLSHRADACKILPDQVIAILLQICDALIAAHAAGVIHRDLKLDNVFLIDNPEDPSLPRVKLLDWGIAKVISADPRHTVEGQLVGTPQYLAPEQARGAAVSPQTDVYSLGVMAYEMFLEQLPFEAETSAEIMAMHLRAIPPPPRELWPDIPPDLECLLLAMLAKDPHARPTTLAVVRALECVQRELIRRRHAVVTGDLQPDPAPEPPRCARWSSAPGLATTGLARSKERRRRWQFAIGAAALAASAMMFVATRDDSDAAPVTVAGAPLRAAAPVVEPAHRKPGLDDALVTRTVTAPVAVVAPAPEPHSGRPVAAIQIAPKPRAHTSRKLPVTPHRPLALDPDGTIDPY